MLKQEKKSSLSDFLRVIAIVCMVYVLSSVVAGIVKNQLAGDVFALMVFCVYGYFVLVRYSAVYTYTLSEKRFKISRQIGKRHKEAEISKKDIIDISKVKPKVKTTFNFSRFIINRKNTMYLIFNNEGVKMSAIFECDDEMKKALIEYGYLEH